MARSVLSMMLLGSVLAASMSYADEVQKMYRWVDEDGVVHVGDSIPARYADQKKEILNEQGVAVGIIAGKATAEELAAQEAERERIAEAERARRADMALLATYLSVNEIERHRDRRVELIESQARVDEMFLTNLRKSLVSLLDEAADFKPYTVDPDAPMIRPALAEEIKDTKDRIVSYEGRLAQKKRESDALREEFSHAIMRYTELTQASR